jgi:anti-anti-sigma factor
MRDVPESTDRQTMKSGMAEGRQFSVISIREAQRIVVRARGRLVLGHGAHEPLWASQLDQPATDVALDLSCVSDLDARGLGVLATFVRRAQQRGTTVSLLAASRVVQRLGEMTGLDRALHGAWNERTGVFRCGARAPFSNEHSAERNSVCGAAA